MMDTLSHVTAEQIAAIEGDDAYARAIRVHCPDDDGTITVRVAIARIRDDAATGIRKAMPEAAIVLDTVVRLAAYSAHAPVPASRLIRILSALTLTMEAARALDRVQRNG